MRGLRQVKFFGQSRLTFLIISSTKYIRYDYHVISSDCVQLITTANLRSQNNRKSRFNTRDKNRLFRCTGSGIKDGRFLKNNKIGNASDSMNVTRCLQA